MRGVFVVALPYYLAARVESFNGVKSNAGVHPHKFVWQRTLENSPNSFVHPSVDLAIRPPSNGGTGIVAKDVLTEGSVALSLSLHEIGMIDARSILDGFDAGEDDDSVLSMLSDMWKNEVKHAKDKEVSEDGKRLAVLAGCLAHLQLTRFKDKTAWTSNEVNEGHALRESRRLGPFLDAMPLLPTPDGTNPMPTHYLYWSDDEIQMLLAGTFGLTRARENRAGIGLVLRQWSPSFLKEHSTLGQTAILNSVFSSFASVMSRSFGDDVGRDLDGKGRMLVPVVDMLNHDTEDPNVHWTWHVKDDEDEISQGKGDILVTALRDIKAGEELLKCYGWRPSWDIASSYGFVPALNNERWDCAVIPLFPPILDLEPDEISPPTSACKDETRVDMLLESNYGPLVKGVLAAVNAASEIRARQDGGNEEVAHLGERPDQLRRVEVVSLFRPAPANVDIDFAFPRRQPCVVIGTKIQSESCKSDNSLHHKEAIDAVIPAFKAAASAMEQLRRNHREGNTEPISAAQMAKAAASLDTSKDWDTLGIELLEAGIRDRIDTLVQEGRAANAWLATSVAGNSKEREMRAGMAQDVRSSELAVLRAVHPSAQSPIRNAS